MSALARDQILKKGGRKWQEVAEIFTGRLPKGRLPQDLSR
jgi:hypothetical protein